MGAAIVFLFNEELIMPCYRGFLVRLKRCFCFFSRGDAETHGRDFTRRILFLR